MYWRDMTRQLKDIGADTTRVVLPCTRAVLSDTGQGEIEGGLLDIGKHLREVPVRSGIVSRQILKKDKR